MKITATLATMMLCLFVLCSHRPCGAQSAPAPHSEYLLTTNDANSAPPSTPAGDSSTEDSPSPTPQGGTPQAASSGDNGWHVAVSPYLWFPGVHGTVGAFGREADFKSSASDLLSNVRFGVMGGIDIRRGRILATGDLMFVRLGDDKALPFPNLPATTAKLTADQFTLTPKVGYRLVDQGRFKADLLAGIRYWRFTETLKFSPSTLGLNFSKTQDWVDPVVGGRITLAALDPRWVVTVAGDVGGWDTGSHLEYQMFAVLGYKIKPKMTLQGGYRYLYFDYQGGGRVAPIVKNAMSGFVVGSTYTFK